MAKMPQEVQESFNKADAVVFATADAEGQPNACIVGMKMIIDDETLYMSDQFFKKTLANIKENPKVAIVYWGKDGAYNIHGSATYVNEGPEFEALAKKVNETFEKMGRPIKTKGGCFVHVDAVYNSSAGPAAGDQIV